MNNVFRKFSAFHDETGRLNVDGMNIISNDGSNKLNRSRKARVSYKVQRTINASLNAATSTRAVSSNPNFVTRLIFAAEGLTKRSAVGFLLRSLIMFQTFISRHNSNFFSDKLVLTSVTPASSAPVLQTPKATSSTLYFDSLTVNAGNGGFLHCIQMDTSVNAAN